MPPRTPQRARKGAMPARMHLAARLATARGGLEVEVTQRFAEYREAETGARLVDPARAR